ncbi:MAG: response regulator [SAR324 cluster bacterium]|nr:response regulator [SAR324 cluster bacterium]
MKFQTKIILAILPIVTLAIIGLGGWSFFKARESIYQHNFHYMSLLLKETITNHLERRLNLLEQSKMNTVDFFIKDYQREALDAVMAEHGKDIGHFFILDKNAQVILSTQNHDPLVLSTHWKNVLNEASASPGRVQGYLIDSVYHHLYVGTHFEPWNWQVFYIIEDKIINESIFHIFWGMIVTMAICAFGAVLTILLISKKILVEPILILTESASLIANQQPIQSIAVDSNDELGRLARSMEAMSKKLQQNHEELKQVNQELEQENRLHRQTADRLESLLHTLPGITFVLDADGRHLEILTTEHDLLYAEIQKLKGQLVRDVMPEDAAEMIMSVILKTVETGQNQTVEYQLEVPAGKNWFEGRTTLLEYPIHDKKTIIWIAQDITKRKQLEEQLLQSQKMESLGIMAGGIAHEFNNNLGSIQGLTELLQMELTENKDAMRYLESIYQSTERGVELVKQILTYSRTSVLELNPVFIAPAIKEALKMMRFTIPARIEIRQNIDQNCPPILGNTTQIHQIIVNLCTNAYHAMQEGGGVLEVSLQKIDYSQELRAAGFSDKFQEGCLHLMVKDTGMGISHRDQERLFDPFFTTKEAGKGTGLGLSVVHGIVESHQGLIRVESAVGQGATFHLYFPVIKKKPAASAEANPAKSGNEHVFIVDNDANLVMFYKEALARLGYQTTVFTDGQKALDAFKADPDQFDIVFTALDMPKMTGMQLSRKVLEIKRDIPIILATGLNDDVSEKELEPQGIHHFIVKPVKLVILTEIIRQAMK